MQPVSNMRHSRGDQYQLLICNWWKASALCSWYNLRSWFICVGNVLPNMRYWFAVPSACVSHPSFFFSRISITLLWSSCLFSVHLLVSFSFHSFLLHLHFPLRCRVYNDKPLAFRNHILLIGGYLAEDVKVKKWNWQTLTLNSQKFQSQPTRTLQPFLIFKEKKMGESKNLWRTFIFKSGRVKMLPPATL